MGIYWGLHQLGEKKKINFFVKKKKKNKYKYKKQLKNLKQPHKLKANGTFLLLFFVPEQKTPIKKTPHTLVLSIVTDMAFGIF